MAKRATRVTKDVPGQELLAFIDEIEHRLEIVDTECQVQQWENYLKKGNAPALLNCESERASLLLDEDLWLTVMRWAGKLSPTHPAWRRLVLLGRQTHPRNCGLAS